MLLADVLALASRKVNPPSVNSMNSLSPRLLIDFATLTGTCITSLSNRYIGVFTNRKEYVTELIRAGEACGERVWYGSSCLYLHMHMLLRKYIDILE
jgi:leucyl aminopeptidase